MKTACTRCGANVSFMPGTQKVFCEFCGSQIDIKEFEKEEKIKKEKREQISKKETSNNDRYNYDEYTCSTCGAKLITDRATAITDCVYCGSRQLIKEKFTGEFEPKEIIPFKIDRNQFISIYTKYIKKKLLAPKTFKNQTRLIQTKGVYVPYDLFTHDVDIYARGNANLIYESQRSFGSFTHPKWLEREFGISSLVSVDASKRLNDNIMSSIEPFDYNNLEKFNPALLNGFLVEAPNESTEELERKAEARIMNEACKIINDTIEKHISFPKHSYQFKRGVLHANFKKRERKTVLLPVWFINTTYNGKIYSYAMNGQTGKMIGEVPVSKAKVTGLIAGTMILVTMLLLLYTFQGMFGTEEKIDLWYIYFFVIIFIFSFLPLLIIILWYTYKPLANKLKKTKEEYKGVKNVFQNPIRVWGFKLRKSKEQQLEGYITKPEDSIIAINRTVFRNGKPVKYINANMK